jgi:hypothetical protein
MLGISPETVRLRLLRIGYVLKALHSVPQILTDDLTLRVEMCQTMLAALQLKEHNQWHNIVTGDDNWSYFEYVRDRLWISFLDNTPDYPNRTIATERQVLARVWNAAEFQVVAILRTGESFNAAWLIDGNLLLLRDDFFPGGRQSYQKS